MTQTLPPSARPMDDERRGRLILPVLTALVVAVGAGLSAAVSPLAPLGLVLVTILLVAIWRRPLIASIIVASVVPAMAGLARGMPVPGFKASELLLVVCLLPLLFRRAARWRRLSSVDVALTAVAVAGLTLALLAGARGATLNLDILLRQGLFPAFTFATWWVVSRGVCTRAEVYVVLRWVLLVSVVPATLGVLQYFDVPGVREFLISMVREGLLPQPGAAQTRVTGPFTIAHSLGGYLVVPLVVASVLLLGDRTPVLGRRALAVIVAVDAAALVLSVTLTTLAWAPVAILVAAALRKQLGRAVAALAVGAALAAVLFWPALEARYVEQTTVTDATGRGGIVPQTLLFRMLVWERDYLPLIAEAAPLGLDVKPGDVLFVHTESQYITLILRGGVGLLLVTAIAFVVLARRAARASQAEPDAIGAASAALVGVIVFLPVAGLIWPYVTNAGLPQALFGVAGALLALAGNAPRTGQPLDPVPPPALHQPAPAGAPSGR